MFPESGVRVIGKSSGSTNTVTSSTAPPAEFTQAYTNTYNQAQQVGNTPYQQYTGNLVAGLSPDTTAGITAVENAQGIADPYLNSAANYINNSTANLSQYYNPYGQSAMGQYGMANNTNSAAQGFTTQGGTPLSQSQINQYENPYTQQVVNATQAEFNNQNQQQANQLNGNAVSSGAFGGDRTATAQAQLAGQQQLSQAPTIAGLESQGYQQGVQTAEQQQQAALSAGQGLTSEAAQLGQTGAGISNVGSAYLGANEANAWLNSQAGYGMANLGNEALSSTLTGANALLNVGSTEQQQAQSLLNVPYEQYTAAQAYPYQTTSWLSGIASGLGSNAGGTSSTTYPSSSTGSQIAGAGLTGLGVLSSTGAFGSNGYLSNLFGTGSTYQGNTDTSGFNNSGYYGGSIDSGSFSARGGAIPHHASGGSLGNSLSSMRGSPDQQISLPSGNSDVPSVSISYIPSSNQNSGTPLMLQNYGTTSTSTGGGGGTSAKQVTGDLSGIAGTAAGISALAGAGSATTGGLGAAAALLALAKRGGRIPHGMRPDNDNWNGGWQEQHRASAGPVTSVTNNAAGVPQISTSNDWLNSGSSGNTTSYPSSAAGNQGQGAVTPGNSRIQNYLVGQQNSASFTPPTIYNPSSSSFVPAGSVPANFNPAGSSSAASNASTNANNTSTSTNSDAAYWASLIGAMTGTTSQGGSSGWRGGKMPHRDAGGDMPDSQIFGEQNPTFGGEPLQSPTDAAPSMGGMAPSQVGQNTIPLPPSRSTAPNAPTAPTAPTVAANTPPPTGGMAPPDTSQPASGMAPPSQDQGPHGKKPVDWGKMLMYVGANMMAGRSPSALTNIGTGVAQGLKEYDTAEAAATRLADQADEIARKIKQGDDLNAIRQQNADTTQQRAGISQQRADTYQQSVTQRGQQNEQAMEIRRLAVQIQQQRADQGEQRITDQEAEAQARQQYQQQRIQLSQQAQQIAQTNNERNFVQRGTNEQLSAALRWRQMNTPKDNLGNPILAKAPSLEESMSAVGAVVPQQTQRAAPAVPKVGDVRNGYIYKGGNPADPSSWQQQGGGAQVPTS